MKNPKLKKWLLGLLPLAILLLTSGCGLCGSETFQEVYSPSGNFKATLFQRDCGATTGFRTHISVTNTLVAFQSETGNVFQADGHPDWFEIKASWVDNLHLRIEHNGKAIPDLAVSKIGNIEIEYVEITAGMLPRRAFKPSELLLPPSFFPPGWTGEEMRTLGPEVIKGSKENNPYMLYTPPAPAQDFEAGYYVSKWDTIDNVVNHFQKEQKWLLATYTVGCSAPGPAAASVAGFKSAYTDNFVVGFTEHQFEDGSGGPRCKLIAQYDEFFIQFEATISENGLSDAQFNDLVKKIDGIMVQHLRK